MVKRHDTQESGPVCQPGKPLLREESDGRELLSNVGKRCHLTDR
jgi:hypothetical protein